MSNPGKQKGEFYINIFSILSIIFCLALLFPAEGQIHSTPDTVSIDSLSIKARDRNAVSKDSLSLNFSSQDTATTPLSYIIPLADLDLMVTSLKETDYLSDWFEVDTLSKSAQERYIVEKVMEFVKRMEENKKQKITMKQTQILNARWQRTKHDFNEIWTNYLVEIEKKYRINFLKLNRITQEIDVLQKNIEGKTDRLKVVDSLLANTDSQNQEITSKYEAQRATENLRSRLANVSINVIAIGKMQKPNDIDPGEIKRIVEGAVITEVVKEVTDIRLTTYLQNPDLQFLKKFVVTDTGESTQINEYYNFLKQINGVYYTYSIYRIEVFPFRQHLSNRNQQSVSEAYLENTVSYVLQDDGTYKNLTEMEPISTENALLFYKKEQFGTQEQQFLAYAANTANRTNENQMSLLQSIAEEYNLTKTVTGNKKNVLVKQYDQLKEEHESLERKLSELSSELSIKKNERTAIRAVFITTKKEYEEHCKERIVYINKYEHQEISSEMSVNDQCVRLVKGMYSAINQLWGEGMQASILSEDADASNKKTSQLEQQDITYKSRVSAFRILYLTDNAAGIAINLVFKTTWSSLSIFDIDIVKGILTDHQNNKEWKLYVGPYQDTLQTISNIDIIQRKQNNGWKIPIIEEFKTLYQSMQAFEDMEDISVFQQLSWQRDGVFASENTYTDNANGEVRDCFNFQTLNIESLYKTNAAYVLLVRDK